MNDDVTFDQIVYPPGYEAYGGQWVAIRDHEIVAAAEKLDDLFADQRVRHTDGIWRVPEPGVIHFYSNSAAA